MQALRLLVVATLLLAAALAAGQDAGKYVDPQVTQCFDCHAPGLWSPPMNPNYQVFVTPANPEVGEQFVLQGQLLNTWRTELLDMYVTLDISRAPSLSFVGGEPPVATESGVVSIQVDPTTINQAQGANTRVSVPPGATDVRITLVPTNPSATTGADFTMRITDALGEQVDPINQGPKGASEVYHAQGAGAVASHGFGNWTVRGEFVPVDGGGEPSTDAPFGQADFTVTMEAWFNTTEARQQVVYKPGILQQGSREVFNWPVTLTATPAAGERVELIANATTHYDHSGTEPDWENMTINGTAPAMALDNGGTQIGVDLGTIIQAPEVAGVSMAAISEAIGYGAAMLLITSIYTGGIFGKTTRRQLNLVFGSARRRVAFHNFLSYGIIAAAIAHTVIFVWDTIEPNYPWQLGLIWGGLGILSMLLLGVTGALQVPMIRRWNYATWRWIHFGLAIAAIVFTIVHMLLDGAHFDAVQERVGWRDPLVPDSQQA